MDTYSKPLTIGQALAKLRWKGRLSPVETRKAAERLMARLHTQAAVGAACGVSQVTVGNWLRGKTRAPASILELCDKVTQTEDGEKNA